MKRILSLILVLVLALTVMVGCDKIPGLDKIKLPGLPDLFPGNDTDDKNDNITYDVAAAVEYVRSLYIKGASTTESGAVITPDDYEVVAQVRVAGVVYTVDWTVDNAKVKLTKGETSWTVDVDSKAAEAHDYKLTATVKAGDGTTGTVTFNRHVPKYNVISFEDYMAAEKGATVTVEGIVVAMTSESLNNKYNHLFLADPEGKGGIYVYDLSKDPVKDLGIKVGMTVSVTSTVEPYSGMQELKGGTATIVDSTIKEVPVLDITELVKSGADLKNYVGLVVTMKGVTISTQELEKDTSQYLNFTLGNTTSYVRTYVTDFPTTFTLVKDEKGNVSCAAKTEIDEAHAAKFGWTANATGILVLYNSNPYLIPMGTDCFEYLEFVEKTPAEKVAIEKEELSVPANILEDTTLKLPLVGNYYNEVTIAWTIDNDKYTIDEEGNLAIALANDPVVLKLTATIKCGDVTETATFEINVKAITKGVYVGEHVDSPVAGTAYKFYLTAKDGKNYYFNGIIDGKFLQTSTNIADGVDVYLEEVKAEDGTVTGYRFYFDNAGTKTYIDITSDGKATLVTENPVAVYGYVADTNSWAATVGGTAYYLGTYSSYTTIGASKTSYINAENTGVSQFPANFASIVVISNDEHVCEFKDATCTAPKTCECGKTEGVALGHNIVDKVCTGCGAKVVTLTEAATLEDGTLVFVEVTVSKITYNWSDSSKNMSADVTDGTTTLNAYKLASKVGVGDVIVIYGKVGSYNGTKQIAEGATAEIKTAHVCANWSNATCTAPKTCTVCGKTEGGVADHTYDNGKCSVCGADEPSANATSATLKYSGSTTGNMTGSGNEAASVGLDASLFTVTCDKCDNRNNPGLNKSAEIRMYAAESTGTAKNGNEIVVTIADGYVIKSITIKFTGASYAKACQITAGSSVETTDGSSTTVTFNINANSFEIKNVAESGQVRFSSIEIVYEKVA